MITAINFLKPGDNRGMDIERRITDFSAIPDISDETYGIEVAVSDQQSLTAFYELLSGTKSYPYMNYAKYGGGYWIQIKLRCSNHGGHYGSSSRSERGTNRLRSFLAAVKTLALSERSILT